MKPCEICDGTGKDPAGEHYPGSASSRCPKCNGTGIIKTPIETGHKLYDVHELKNCPTCNGTGQHQIYDSDHVTSCETCDGTGDMQE